MPSSISRSSSTVTTIRVLAIPASWRHRFASRGSSLSSQCCGRSAYRANISPWSWRAALCPSGSSGISNRNPRAAACHHRSRLLVAPSQSVTSPNLARCRRCQLTTEGDAPTSGESWVAVAGPCRWSRSRIASRTGCASARNACGSLISKSTKRFLRDMFRE